MAWSFAKKAGIMKSSVTKYWLLLQPSHATSRASARCASSQKNVSSPSLLRCCRLSRSTAGIFPLAFIILISSFTVGLEEEEEEEEEGEESAKESAPAKSARLGLDSKAA
jgi:hypothetical protein